MKARFLSTTILVAACSGAVYGTAISEAVAACTSVGTAVTCSGSTAGGYDAGADDTENQTVNVATGANLAGGVRTRGGNDFVINEGNISDSIDLGESDDNALDRVINQQAGIVGSGGVAIIGTTGRQELFNYSRVNGSVVFGEGDDFVLNEGTITGLIDLGDSAGPGDLSGGDVVKNLTGVIGSDGSDGNPSTLGSAVIVGDAGRQLISNGGHIFGNIVLGEGSDEYAMFDSSILSGSVDLGAGDDVLSVNSDQSVVTGTINAGAGNDIVRFGGSGTGSLNDTLTSLSGMSGFESLEINSLGTWQVDSNYSTGYDIDVQNGTLEVNPAVNFASGAINVASGGTIINGERIDFAGSLTNAGTLDGGVWVADSGNTLFSNTGTITQGTTIDLGFGSDQINGVGDLQGTIDMSSGADSFTLTESATFGGQVSGGAGSDTDTLILAGSGGALDDQRTSDFELLQHSEGSWTVTGSHAYSDGIELTASGATANSTPDIMVGTGGHLTGDVTGTGAGAQHFAVAGIYSGNADMGAGDDRITLLGGSLVSGTFDGGAGNDHLAMSGNGLLSTAVSNFTTASVNGNWEISGGSTYSFSDGLTVEAGGLTLYGQLIGGVNLDNGTVLNGNGVITGDSSVSGTVNGDFQMGGGSETLLLAADGVIANGASFNLGAGSDTFDHRGQLFGQIDYSDGADTHRYYYDDPDMNAGALISGGQDAAIDVLSLEGQRNSGATSGRKTIDAQQFTNFEELAVNGGHWASEGDFTFSNGAAVNGGNLEVDGTLTLPANETLNVGPDGTLGGTGTIVADVVVDGTVNPAGIGSTGTLTIDGDATFNEDSRLVIDLGQTDGNSDVLAVTGDLTLDGTLTFAPIDDLPAGLEFDFLDVDGTVSGEFDDITTQGILDFDLDTSDPNNPIIVVTTDFGGAATPGNTSALGDYIDSLGGSINNDVLQALFDLAQSGDQDRLDRALAQMSPDMYDQHTAALFERSRSFADAMLRQLGRCDVQRRHPEELLSACNSRNSRAAGKSTVWTSFSGGLENRDGENRYLDYEYRTAGGQMGFDTKLGSRIQLGAAVGSSRTTVKNAIRGNGSATDLDLGVYGQARLTPEGSSMPVDLGLTVNYGFGANRGERFIEEFSSRQTADFDSRRLAVSTVLATGTSSGRFEFDGKLKSNWTNVKRDEINETGEPGLTLTVLEDSYNQLDVGAQAGVGYRLRMSDTAYLVPNIGAGIRHIVVGEERELEARFSNVNSANTFKVSGSEVPTTFDTSVGLRYQNVSGMYAFFNINGRFGDGVVGGAAEAGIRYEF